MKRLNWMAKWAIKQSLGHSRGGAIISVVDALLDQIERGEALPKIQTSTSAETSKVKFYPSNIVDNSRDKR
jgi:hypothetical protein